MNKLVKSLYLPIYHCRRVGNSVISKLLHPKVRLLFYRFIRSPFLNLFGYQIVNPYYNCWDLFPSSRMKLALDDILDKVGISEFDTVIDHGCGPFGHYISTLKNYSKKVIGVDIIDRELVKGIDYYIQVPSELKDSYFDSIESASVDCVFVLSITGMYPSSNWNIHSSDLNNRIGRYLTKSNFPRILKEGGYLIRMEWESFPERRFGKRSYSQISANIERYYPGGEIPSFKIIFKGFSRSYYAPYIVYKKVSNSGKT